MSEFERWETPERIQRQIDVFGAARMAMLEGHEATPESTEELLCAIGTIAIAPGSTDHQRIMCRGLHRAGGRPLVAQANPYEVPQGFGSTEEDRALATVYGLKNQNRRVLIPTRGLHIGVYEVDETIYVDRDRRAKILKKFIPLRGNIFRYLAAAGAYSIAARKLATEDEVQEALEIITSVVFYDDQFRASGAQPY